VLDVAIIYTFNFDFDPTQFFPKSNSANDKLKILRGTRKTTTNMEKHSYKGREGDGTQLGRRGNSSI